MAKSQEFEPLDSAIEEYFASFEDAWAAKTKTKYRAELRDLMAWLAAEGKPLTTESLGYPTLLKYVVYLRHKPTLRGVWRGRPDALEQALREGRAGTRSLNSVNASMRSIQGFTNWMFHKGRLAPDPFDRSYARNGRHPLLPRENAPKKSAKLEDIQCLERGCSGSSPIDLRDQAIVAVLKTTVARNGPVRNLRLTDVDLERNIIHFPREKGDRRHDVALLPEAKAAILRYLNRGRRHLLPRYPVRGMEDMGTSAPDEGFLFVAMDNGSGKAGGPLSAGALSDMINDRYHKGGGTIPSFRSHRIRHGTATILANNGMPIPELSRQMDHASVQTTMVYAPQSPETLGGYVQSVYAKTGLSRPARRR